jgi:signal transduction histidine kinase
VGLEVKRLNGVLEMLLEYGQLGTPRTKKVDLQRRMLASLGEKKREIAERRISIRTEDLENLPAVHFDEDQLKFVLRRVLESVVAKEIENRQAAIRWRLRRPEEPGAEARVELEIWYDGREGVVKDIHQVEIPGGRYDFEGLSLGLGLARRVMLRNRGEMQVHQEEEVGTTVILRFPRQPAGDH